jgi:hypothetical protein
LATEVALRIAETPLTPNCRRVATFRQDGNGARLTERSRLEPQAESPNLISPVCSRPADCHSGVDLRGIYSVPVINDEKLEQATAVPNEADEHVARLGIDRVVDELSDSGFKTVVPA